MGKELNLIGQMKVILLASACIRFCKSAIKSNVQSKIGLLFYAGFKKHEKRRECKNGNID